MSSYQVLATDSNGFTVLMGTAETAGVALGQLRASRRGPPVHDIRATIDGQPISEAELANQSKAERNA